MASLVEKLTSEGTGGESAEFLNNIIKELWPNINAYGSKTVKDVVEPMFKTMLPGPLASLHFTKIDLGPVPMRLSNAVTTRTDADGIRLNMNVDWASKSDIEMDADMMPALGVESIHLHGRLEILLCPLTNTIPLIGAAQIAFINPPVLELDFTGAANVADFSAIDGTVRKTILGIINSMFTLPNRYLLKLDSNADYFKTFHYPLGVARVTIDRAWGFSEEAKWGAKKLFSKLTRAAPDCYAEVEVGGEEPWRTQTLNNTHKPVWNETKDFVVSDYQQHIKIDINDHDVNGDDDVGMAVTTVREILMSGGKQELPMTDKGKETGGMVSISCQYFQFAPQTGSLSASDHKGEGRLSGIATVLIAGAYDIEGNRKELKPSVVVTMGQNQRFQTAIKTYSPGTDVNDPTFDQAFRIPLTSDGPQNFRLALMNGEKEIGAADVSFAEVTKAENMTLEKTFDVGGGMTIRGCICVRGLVPGEMPKEKALPQRSK